MEYQRSPVCLKDYGNLSTRRPSSPKRFFMALMYIWTRRGIDFRLLPLPPTIQKSIKYQQANKLKIENEYTDNK